MPAAASFFDIWGSVDCSFLRWGFAFQEHFACSFFFFFFLKTTRSTTDDSGAMDGGRLRLSRYSLAYRKRLVNSSQLLWKFLEKKGLPRSVIATGKSKTIDTLLDEFVASLHDSKTFVKGRLQIAKHAVLFCQVCRPRLRRRLQQTWSTLKAWEEQEPGKLRPPLPIPVLMGMLCQSRILSQLADGRGEKHKWLTFSTLIAMGFFGLLRPGELLNLKRRDIELANQVNLCLPCVTISLDKPKNFRQLGFKQFTTVKHLVTCEWFGFKTG